jgi:integral membrane protein
VKNILLAYRVLANVVGVLLLVATLGSLAKYLLPEGSSLQQLGADLAPLWLAHGWIYMAYLVVAFVLLRRARWSIPSFLPMLLAGLVPGLMFYVERRVVRRVRAQFGATV